MIELLREVWNWLNKNSFTYSILSPKSPTNKHKSGELLVLASREVSFGYNILGNWGCIPQPAIA